MAEPVLRNSILEWARPNECQTTYPHLPTFFHAFCYPYLLLFASIPFPPNGYEYFHALTPSYLYLYNLYTWWLTVDSITGVEYRKGWEDGRGIQRGTIRHDKPSCPPFPRHVYPIIYRMSGVDLRWCILGCAR